MKDRGERICAEYGPLISHGTLIYGPIDVSPLVRDMPSALMSSRWKTIVKCSIVLIELLISSAVCVNVIRQWLFIVTVKGILFCWNSFYWLSERPAYRILHDQVRFSSFVIIKTEKIIDIALMIAVTL
jgi:hypothetical protein